MNRDIRRMRPMGIADILDETVELYKTSFVLLVGIAAVMQVPYSILVQFATVHMLRFTTLSTTGKAPAPADVFPMLGMLALSYLYLLVAAPFVTGALTYAISERYLGRKATIVGSFRRVFSLSVFGQLLVAILVKAMILVVPSGLVGIAFVMVVLSATVMHGGLWVIVPLAIVLGLAMAAAAAYLLLRFALVESAVVVEMKGISHALARSWTLMPGSLVKCFVLFLVSWVVTGIVTYMTTAPTQTLIVTGMAKGAPPSHVILVLHTLISAISGTILAPVMSIVTILLYYDIRVRREGFDLELLASELHAKTRQAGEWTAPALPHEQAPVEQASPSDTTEPR
jgi:hypothetical protein